MNRIERTIVACFLLGGTMNSAYGKHCSEDFVPFGMETYRNYWQEECEYVKPAMTKILTSEFNFDDMSWREKGAESYLVWGRMIDEEADYWKPEELERYYPSSCSKPRKITILSVCDRVMP